MGVLCSGEINKAGGRIRIKTRTGVREGLIVLGLGGEEEEEEAQKRKDRKCSGASRVVPTFPRRLPKLARDFPLTRPDSPLPRDFPPFGPLRHCEEGAIHAQTPAASCTFQPLRALIGAGGRSKDAKKGGRGLHDAAWPLKTATAGRFNRR